MKWVAPELESLGHDVLCETFPRGRYIVRLFAKKTALRSTRLLILSKIKLSPLETVFLRRMTRSIAFDFDDAIYFRRPRRLGDEPDRSWWRLEKFKATCRMADLVIAGNRVLAERAQGAARRVEVVPTPVDAESYEPTASTRGNGHTLVWIGLPENLVYLELIRPVLAELTKHHRDLRLRIVSSEFPDWPEIPIEKTRWSEESEVEALTSADIGLMPLTDDDWTRGKCAFKLLQYMAAGLPCAASAVGANLDVVRDGDTGFLATTRKQWFEKLDTMLGNAGLRNSMGAAGRKRLLEHYDRRVIAPRMVNALTTLL